MAACKHLQTAVSSLPHVVPIISQRTGPCAGGGRIWRKPRRYGNACSIALCMAGFAISAIGAGMAGCEALANYDRYGSAGPVWNEIAALFQGCYAMRLSGVVFSEGRSNAIPFYLSLRFRLRIIKVLELVRSWEVSKFNASLLE